MIQTITEFVNWNHFPAVISLVVASIAAWSAIRTSKVNHKNQIDFENRKMKQGMYFAYLDAVGDYGNVGKNRTADDRIENANQWAEAHNKLVLVGNAESINSMMEFEECAKKSNGERQPGEYESVLDHMIKAFRTDLFDDQSVNRNLKPLSLLSVLSNGK